MCADLEAFVAAHRPCGDFTHDVGEPTEEGYRLHHCGGGETFAR